MRDLEMLDGYLLGERLSKADVIATLLAGRSSLPAAAPFYRALEAVGPRAADEALIALRLVLAGLPPEDERVRRLRAIAARAKGHPRADAAAIRAEYERELGF